MSFAGSITNDYELFKTLENLSLFITPELTNEESIGNLNHVYDETIAIPRTGSRRGSVAGTPEGYSIIMWITYITNLVIEKIFTG